MSVSDGSTKVAEDDRDEDEEVPSTIQPFLLEKDGEMGAVRPVGRSVPTEAELKKEKLRIWKNVLVVSLAIMGLFTAQGVVAVLQSSINSEAGLGVLSQAMIHVSTIVSSLFLPALVIRWLNLKWTMVLGTMCFLVYVLVQFYPKFATLVPAAIIVGLGAAPLGSAQATYLTQAGMRYADILGEKDSEPAIARFFGVFGMILSTCTIWGSLINSAVLSRGIDPNRTINFSPERLSFCGANFCLTRNLTAAIRNATRGDDDFFNSTGVDSGVDELPRPSQENVYILFGILGGCIVLAGGAISLFVDKPPKELETVGADKLTGCQLAAATFKHAMHPYQLLLIPLTMFSGFSLAFLTAEFTAAYVVCAWGVEHIGYVLVAYGITSSIFCIFFGILVKRIGRMPIILFGSLVSLLLFLTLLFFWHPDPEKPELLFVVSGVYGVANGVWMTQLNSLYGVIFNDNKEPAFANLRLWQSLGYAFAFAAAIFMCVGSKLYLIISILILGTVGYIIVEIKEKRRLSNSK